MIWENLKGTMLGDEVQTLEVKYYVIPFLQNP